MKDQERKGKLTKEYNLHNLPTGCSREISYRDGRVVDVSVTPAKGEELWWDGLQIP